MTRTIQVHPLSLFIGVGVALLGVVAMGQMPAAKRPAASHDSGLLQVAHPRDWVRIEQGQPFSVPTGKILVVTGLGGTTNVNDVVELHVNGVRELHAVGLVNIANGATVKELPVGFAVAAPSTVDVVGVNGYLYARAWGYLVDA